MAIQSIEILRDYMTCEDPGTRNKYFNLLESFYHKSEGKILESIEEDADNVTLLFTSGNTLAARTPVVIPKLPNSKPISFIQNLQDALNSKVNTQPGKGLSEANFTTQEKQKLAGLSNFELPITMPITFIEGLENALLGKVDAEEGKGLSTEDFTTELQQRLLNIQTNYLALPMGNLLDVTNPHINFYNWQTPTPDINFEIDTLAEGGKVCIRVNADTGGDPAIVTVDYGTKLGNVRRICDLTNWKDAEIMEIYVHGLPGDEFEWWFKEKQR